MSNRDDSYCWLDDDYSVGYVVPIADADHESRIAIVGVMEEDTERREVYITRHQAEALIRALQEKIG